MSDDESPDGVEDAEPEQPLPLPPPPAPAAEPDVADAPDAGEPLIQADRGLPPDAYLAGDPDEEY